MCRLECTNTFSLGCNHGNTYPRCNIPEMDSSPMFTILQLSHTLFECDKAMLDLMYVAMGDATVIGAVAL